MVLAALLLAWPTLAALSPCAHAFQAAPEPVSGVPTGAAAGILGRVFEDRNANGVLDAGEPGIADAWITLVSDTATLARTRTNAYGDYALGTPADGAARERLMLQCVPAPGFYPTGTSVRSWPAIAARPGQQDFGLTAFRQISLSASNIQCLGTGDVMEKDWPGNQTADARGDQDLVAGAGANGSDQLSVWFNGYDANPLFNAARDYTRIAPNTVLSLAVASIAEHPAPFRSRADVVIGTRRSSAGNFFTWFNQDAPGSEGYLPSSYTQACRTRDDGDVQAIVAGDVSGGRADLVVGTRSPESGRGTIELWKSDDAPVPAFAFAERYPDAGAPAAASLGEVTALSLAGLSGAGRHVVAGTSFGGWGGQLIVFGRGRSGTGVLTPLWNHTYSGDAVRCLVAADVTGDGKLDLVVGTQNAPDGGHLELWRNDTQGEDLAFTLVRSVPVTGVPLCMASADFGGSPGPDVAVGFGDDISFGGRVEVFYCDLATLPALGSDPSAGRITGRVPALATSDFDTARGRNSHPTPSRADLAAGVRTDGRDGGLFIIVR